jgi:hypothetical protein
MDLVVMGVIAGATGTLAMDSLNLLFARIGMLSKIDVGMIGRMAVGLDTRALLLWASK